jgi:hypothetical protein
MEFKFLYELDPSGKVVLVLDIQQGAAAEDQRNLDEISAKNEEGIDTERRSVIPSPPSTLPSPDAPHGEVLGDEPDEGPPLEQPPFPEDQQLEIQTPASAKRGCPDDWLQTAEASTSERPNSQIRFRVSARHLTLASPFFERSLKRGWCEGETLYSSGHVEISVLDCDPEALLILLKIIHCQPRSVPRRIGLDLLTKLAVLVDYYKCHEAVDVFSDLWIDYLRKGIPDTYSDDLIRWIWISWVFRKGDLFKMATRAAQRWSDSPMKTLGLPITDSIRSKNT